MSEHAHLAWQNAKGRAVNPARSIRSCLNPLLSCNPLFYNPWISKEYPSSDNSAAEAAGLAY